MSLPQGPQAVLLAQYAVLQGKVPRAQLPAPLQAPTGVTMAAAQLAVPHEVLEDGYWQVSFVPSQLPAQASLPPQPARAPRGAPRMCWQIPGEPVSLHEKHWPVQSELQQTPSAQ